MFVPEKSREILGRVRCKVEEAIRRPQGGSLQPFNGRCSLVGGDLVKSSQDVQMVRIVLQFSIFRHYCPMIIIMLWFGFGNQWLPCYSQFGRMFHHLPNFPSPLNGVGAFLSVSRLFHNAAYIQMHDAKNTFQEARRENMNCWRCQSFKRQYKWVSKCQETIPLNLGQCSWKIQIFLSNLEQKVKWFKGCLVACVCFCWSCWPVIDSNGVYAIYIAQLCTN